MVKTAMSGRGLAPQALKAASPRERDICSSSRSSSRKIRNCQGKEAVITELMPHFLKGF
jgi:hypothetical protein